MLLSVEGAAFHTQAPKSNLWRAKSIPVLSRGSKPTPTAPTLPLLVEAKHLIKEHKTSYKGAVPHLLLTVPNSLDTVSKPQAVCPRALAKVGDIKGSREKTSAQLVAQTWQRFPQGNWETCRVR